MHSQIITSRFYCFVSKCLKIIALHSFFVFNFAAHFTVHVYFYDTSWVGVFNSFFFILFVTFDYHHLPVSRYAPFLLWLACLFFSRLPLAAVPPPPELPPAAWWGPQDDQSLVVGAYKHGYENYALMRADANLSFLAACGPPTQADLEAQGGGPVPTKRKQWVVLISLRAGKFLVAFTKLRFKRE